MPAQRRGAALFDGRHDLQLPQAQVCRGPPRWPVAAEDVRNLQHEALQRAGLIGRQTVQRTGDLMQQIGGHLGVKRGGLKLLVTEQHLDHADVHLLFEQVCGETVPQGVHGYTFVDVCGLGGGMNDAVQLPQAELVNGIAPGKEPPAIEHPALGPCDVPPDAQALEQHRREHGVAVLVSLACSMRSVMRWLSTSVTFRATTSLARSPAPYATDSAVWCFRLPAASISRRTSSGLSTTGKVRGTRTGCILTISSGRSSVISKKNFSPVIAAFSDTGEVP